jgi:hypothetical protein
MTLEEVIEGLKKGRSFKCALQHPDGGWEWVRPTTPGRFEHGVAGSKFGGVAELDIDVIDEERWTNDGWEPV